MHPSQRFNFPRDNARTTYVGKDMKVCGAEVSGRQGGLVPLKCYWARARVDAWVWDLRRPVGQLGKALARLNQEKRHAWAVKALGTRGPSGRDSGDPLQVRPGSKAVVLGAIPGECGSRPISPGAVEGIPVRKED